MSLRDRSRREFLRSSFRGAGVLAFSSMLYRCTTQPTPTDDDDDGGSGGLGGQGGQGGQGGMGGQGGSQGALTSNIANLGPLGEPDENGVRLPAGFTSRVVARTGQVPAGNYVWHPAPDGGAVFPTDDGGWIYVSNNEMSSYQGGVGALVFSPTGDLVNAYSLLTGTSRNCGGGPTPWGTWLSCEEVYNGQVWECDPLGVAQAVVHPLLGSFNHEAVAVDPVNDTLYLTEDASNGLLYRFTPSSYPNLTAGTMEVLEVLNGVDGATQWHPLPDPLAMTTPTRQQVAAATPFDGGEGIWFQDGVVYFSTKGDNRVWAYETATGNLSIIYDYATSPTPFLSGVDNVYVSPGSDVLVAEDGGDLEINAITPDGTLVHVMQLVGHNGSEITGPALDPSLTRLYFSSQRGTTGTSAGGMTFEITGPFFI